MRLFTKLALTGVATFAFAGAIASPAMADTNVHRISLNGSTYITDDETFSDEHCTREVAGWDDAQAPSDGAFFSDKNNKCGGEIRVEFDVSATVRQEDNLVCANVDVRLYEGTSESTNDLDGSRSFSNCFFPGQDWNLNDTVWNTAEGGDKATFKLRLSAT